MKTIELLYFDGCPNYVPALNELQEALREVGANVAVESVLVSDTEDAQAKHFRGSPSISIDGIDLEGDVTNGDFAMRCRRYRDGDNILGYPSRANIVRVLRERLEAKA